VIFIRFHDGDRPVMVNLAHVIALAVQASAILLVTTDGTEYLLPCSMENFNRQVSAARTATPILIIDL
jgi:DNA-binding LytR/AlgR family response regulator